MANWFVAIPVRGEGWLERVVADPPPRVRPFAAADLHLTVAFLGPVDEDAARRGWAAAAAIAGEPRDASLGAVVPMGSPRRFSALSALLEEGREEVARFMGAARGPVLAAAGARPDERPPLPHVTLARLHRRARPGDRAAALAWVEGLATAGIPIRLEALALYTHARPGAERRFRIVEERPLGAA